MGLNPTPPRLEQVAAELSVKEIYWAVSNGIKMTAMPAWRFRLGERDLWAIVAFVETLPKLSPEVYGKMASAMPPEQIAAGRNVAADLGWSGGDARPNESVRSLGKIALNQYACSSCHDIPGITGPTGRIGPSLHDIGKQKLIGGRLPNTVDNMAAWIQHPQYFKPGTGMPDMGVSALNAADIAFYLTTQSRSRP